MKFKYQLLASLALLAQMNASSLFAASPTWLNNTSQLNLGTNWSSNPTVPGPTDDPIFPASGNPNPTLNAGTFSINSGTFSTVPYTFTLTGAGAEINFSGDHSVSGPITLPGNPTIQRFDMPIPGANVNFNLTASADPTNEGHVVYHTTFQTGVQFYDNSKAGSAHINATGGGNVGFLNDSDAQTAVITANTGTLVFFDNSVGNHATINLSGGIDSRLFFNDNSSPQSSNLTATNNSLILFNTSVSTGGLNGDPTVVLSTGGNVAVVQTITLGSLTSDATSPTDLNGGNLIVGTNNTSTTVAGPITEGVAGSTFNKVGTGTLTLSGNNTYTGLTTVQVGVLNLNGQIAGNAITNLGAIFSGTGTVGGNLTVNGGVAPGNSIGTLNVAGNYIQNSGSTYFLEIDGLGNSDLINVTGTATLNGGQVVVTSLTGTALTNTPYTILTAAGGVSGQFAGVSTTNLLLTPTLTYDANHAYVVFAKTVFHFDAVTPNQIAVATQLESITNPTPEEFLILSTLDDLPAEAQQRALDEMSGVQYASLNLISEIASRQFIRRLYDPLRSIVTTEPCNDCCYECPCPTLDLWLEAGGGQTFLDGNSNVRGLKLNSWEVTAGVQSTFKCNWTVGIAGSYVEDCIKHDIGGSGKNRMGFGAIYGLYRPSNFYVLADLGFGGGEFNVNRSIDIGVLSYTAKGRPKHYHAIGYIEAGFDWNTCNFLVQPFLGFEGGYFKRNSFSETGTSPLNLNINKQTYGNAFSRLGVHLTTKQWSALKLSVDVAWDCRLTSNKASITESFQDFGAPFVITGVSRNRNSVDAAATITTKLCGGWELYAEVGGEFWSKVSTYNVLGGVKYTW